MKPTLIADALWGKEAKFRYLFLAAILLLFTLLGAKEIWTQEHRWADIVAGMFYRHDFLHPYLGESKYYDKPLLSYWLIAIIAKIMGDLSAWSLRLPSALAGLLAIGSIYRIGYRLRDKQLGLLAGWLLLTTFYFVFWARISSADMLNLGGSLFAIAWYMDHRQQPSFFSYAIFFLIIALTSLCKGLVGAIVPLLAVCTDIVLNSSYRTHLRSALLFAALPALIIYFVPFFASTHFGGEHYGQNGLYLVYRENILRYFQPFDHVGPIYTYFIYLPIYLLPWAIFFIPALYTLPRRFKTFSQDGKWLTYTLFILFLFFTISGSRRSYYVLPIVPFAILFTADWLLTISLDAKRKLWLGSLVALTFVLLFLAITVIPAWYYGQYGVNHFASILKIEANKIKPWDEWHVVMLDGESKLNFYLQLPPNNQFYSIQGTRGEQTEATLLQTFPILTHPAPNTIYISRKRYAKILQKYFTDYRMVDIPSSSLPFLKKHAGNNPIAFIPNA